MSATEDDARRRLAAADSWSYLRARVLGLGPQPGLLQIEVRLDAPEEVLLESALGSQPQQGPALDIDQLLTSASIAGQGILDRRLAVLAREGGYTACEPRLVDLAQPLDRGVGNSSLGRLDLLQPVESGLRRGESRDGLIGR